MPDNGYADEVSLEMEVLIQAVRQGTVTSDGNVIVPADLEGWAKEVLQKATPREMQILDEVIRQQLHS